MHAAFEINLPNYANAIVSADEIIGAIELTEGTAQRPLNA